MVKSSTPMSSTGGGGGGGGVLLKRPMFCAYAGATEAPSRALSGKQGGSQRPHATQNAVSTAYR